MTDTDDRLMAAATIIGDANVPVSRLAFGLDLYVVFCLIHAMIEAACRTSELSRQESDAALYLPIQKN